MNYLATIQEENLTSTTLDPSIYDIKNNLLLNYVLPNSSLYIKANNPIEYNSLLLYGPSGSGKTHYSKAIAHSLSAYWFDISLATLTSNTLHKQQIEQLMSLIFEVAAQLQPAILYMDQIEQIFETEKKKKKKKKKRRRRRKVHQPEQAFEEEQAQPEKAFDDDSSKKKKKKKKLSSSSIPNVIRQMLLHFKSMLSKQRIIFIANTTDPYKIYAKDLHKLFTKIKVKFYFVHYLIIIHVYYYGTILLNIK